MDPLLEAVSVYRSGDFPVAERLCRQALVADPDRAEAHTLLGNLHKHQGRPGESERCHREAVRLAPDSPAALSDLASVLLAGGAAGEAAELFMRVVGDCPQIAAAHANLGTALQVLGRAQEAAGCYRQALSVEPENVPALCNLGSCLRSLGQIEEAIEVLRQARARAPGHMDTEWNLSLALLMAGETREGWASYEVRRRLDGFCIETIASPPWDGIPAVESTLLVHAEQGLGDTLEFLRYLPAVRRRVGRLLFECQAPLARLLREIPGPDEIISRGEPRPEFTHQVPLMSLPHLLGPVEGSRKVTPPVLVPEPALVQRWRDRLGSDSGRRIGIAWQGSPAYKADGQRSIPLAEFAGLAQVPNLTWLSLQKKHGLDQLEQWPSTPGLVNLDPQMDTGPDAFVDTLAILEALDLVICSDSAIAHLAGVANKPVWLLLPAVPDWRWGLEGETTPWYPKMRLFRQQHPGDWEELFERVKRAL